MPKLIVPIAMAASISIAGCDARRTSLQVAALTSDAGSDASPDAAPDASPPGYLDTVLTCGATATAGGLNGGSDLQRFQLDLSVFPDARCNDGSPGVFYVRPATTAGARRWLIELEGGGGCVAPDACARRWCNVGTAFGMDQMSSDPVPASGIQIGGIFYRGGAAANPFADFNQVLIHYCSSDDWTGRTGPITLSATDPAGTGNQVQYQIDFRGQDILDAVIATLRQDGVPPPVYTLGGGAIALDDLDSARYVMLAGTSAGGGGVIHNADRIGDVLRAATINPSFEYNALIDSTFGPNANDLDWTSSTAPVCTGGAGCTWQDVLAAGTTLYPRHGDESCEALHTGTDAWLCKDSDHVIRNHVTTPMMIRQGLRDRVLSDNLIDGGVCSPPGTTITVAEFERLVRDQLLALASIQTTAEEGALISTVPAVFGPPCPDHDTLESSAQVFDARFGVGGVPYRMFDVYTNWRTGVAPSQVVWVAPEPFYCP